MIGKTAKIVVSTRCNTEEVEFIDAFADEKEINRSEALLYFLRAGIAAAKGYKPPNRVQRAFRELRGEK